MFDMFARRPTADIRWLRPDMAEACAAIHAQAFAHPWSVHDLEAMLAAANTVAQGAVEQTLVGFIISRRAADEAEVLTIGVAAAARGRGIGGRLLGAHLPQLVQRGVRRLFLEVDVGNEPALALYRRFGFAEASRRVGYYALPDGSRSTALVLRCDIK